MCKKNVLKVICRALFKNKQTDIYKGKINSKLTLYIQTLDHKIVTQFHVKKSLHIIYFTELCNKAV